MIRALEELRDQEMDYKKKAEGIIFDLIFAYENKDPEFPHLFEMSALISAYGFLTEKSYLEFAKTIIDKMLKKLVEK